MLPWFGNLASRADPIFFCPLFFPVLLVKFGGALSPSDTHSRAGEEDLLNLVFGQLGQVSLDSTRLSPCIQSDFSA